MDAAAFIYELKESKGTQKTYLIRKVFGYKDSSNHGAYEYERPGILTPYIIDKWGKSVIITKLSDVPAVRRILEDNNISYKKKNIKVEEGQ